MSRKAKMRAKARARHKKFKQTRVQTFGGKRTSFSKAEQKRITDAGYSVKGYSKAAPNTSGQVSMDIAKYGNTVPSGSFGISAAGKAQAEENKAIKAAKDSTFNPVNFNSASADFAKGLNLFNTANIMAPGGNMASWYNQGADPTKSFRQVLGDEISMSQRTKGVGKGAWNPFRGMPGYGSIRNVLTGKPFNTKFEGGFESGPTEANRRVFNNLTKLGIATTLFNQGRDNSVTDQIAKGTIGAINPYAGTTDQSPELARGAAARERGSLLSIGGFKVPEFGFSEFMGINAVDRKPDDVNVASTDASGLNVGATAKTGETTGGKLGRTLFNAAFPAAGVVDFLSNDKTDLDMRGDLKLPGTDLSIQPYSVVKDVPKFLKKPIKNYNLIREGISDFNKIKESDDKVKSFFKNVDAKQFFDSAELINQSNVAQDVGESAGFPSNFKSLAGDTYTGLKENLSGYEQGRKFNRIIMNNRVDEINNLLKTINEQPKLKTLSKFLATYESEDDKIKNLKPLDKIKYAMNTEDAPPVKALSMTERGITGAAGNLLIGGKLSDIYNQATGNFEGGVNAGIPKGQVGVSDTDLFNIASSAFTNVNTEGTLSAKKFKEIQNLIGPKGVTGTSLIKGILPRGGGPRRVNTSGSRSQQQQLEELLINQQPNTTTPTQTGTNPNNLSQIQREAYLNQLRTYGFNPNYFARFLSPARSAPPRFRNVFNRNSFA